MKIINSYAVFFLIMVSCTAQKKVAAGYDMPCGELVLDPSNTQYIFYNWYTTDSFTCKVNNIKLRHAVGYRRGTFLFGKQHSLWISTRYAYYDSAGYAKSREYICREEYFKNGLRDSVFKVFNSKGNILYSTYFNSGNGLEKDFYDNGKLFYEVKTVNGYLVDTLTLYNDKGITIEKLLYNKQDLIYKSQ